MIRRLKSGRGSSTVRSCSKMETSRVTRSVKFPGKGSISEPGKSTGCSVSEPTRNLVNRNEVTDLLVTEGRLEHLILTITVKPIDGLPGYQG